MEQGDVVRVEWEGVELEGTVIKREGGWLFLKLKNGYNVVVPADVNAVVLGKRHVGKPGWKGVSSRREEPRVSIVATGGTIASRVDYVTGAVTTDFTVEELLSIVPEVGEVAFVKMKQVMNIFSENMTPEKWVDIAIGVYEELRDAEGVVVTHGTDTMHYTAAALSFMLDTPKPVVLTGAQRSSDRPSSDAAINLVSSVYVAGHVDLSGVFVCMHEGMDDGVNSVVLGTRTRKMHSTRRDAFPSIGVPPVGRVHVDMRGGSIREIRYEEVWGWKRRGDFEPRVYEKLEENVRLIHYYPGMDLSDIMEYRGVIIEGTGMGHVREEVINDIEHATRKGVFVGITTQTIHGRTHPHVYSTAVKMTKAGAVFLGDMLPEVALVKLMWVLGQGMDVKKAMLTNMKGEMNERRVF